MFEINSPQVQFMLQAVRAAAALVKQVQAELVSPAMTKADLSPVTVADFASQALVSSLLEKNFPHDDLVAEEDSTALRETSSASTLALVVAFVKRWLAEADSDRVCAWIDRGTATPGSRFWTLDPLDGTKGFLRGDQYVVALALVEEGRVVLGALGCPNLENASRTVMNGKGSLILAVREQGAWHSDLWGSSPFQELHVSPVEQAQSARILRSFESGHTNVSQIDRFCQVLGVQAEQLRMDSQAKYALLASGSGEICLRLISPSQPEYREKIWDQAAGSMIVEEAGGMITDLDGKPLDFSTGRRLENNRGILATNSLLHKAALNVLREITA